MNKTWKVMVTFLVVLSLLLGAVACGKKNDNTNEDSGANEEGTTLEEGDPDYNVEDDLVDGVLTEDMLDQMEEEEDTTEEEKKDEEKEKDPTANLKKYYIKVNRQTNVVTIYSYDNAGNYTKPVKAMVCSTGKNNGTPKGKFKLSSKHRWQLMNGGVYSQYASRITGHILFHSVPYYEMKNDTLCTGYYNQLGNQASAGCVRLSCADAKWIYSNCASGTVVEIYDGNSSNDPLGKPGAIRIPTDSPYKRWDPTDPDSNNPWKKAKPTITAENFTVELGSDNVDLASKVTAKDAYGATLKPEISGNVDTKKLGTYSITYSVTDSRGNSAKTTITVTVKDTRAPEISNDLDGKIYEGELTDSAIRSFVKEHTTVKDASGTASISGISVTKANGKISCVITAVDSSKNTATLSITMSYKVEEPETPSTEEPETPSTEEPEVPSTEEPEVPSTEEPETPSTENPEDSSTESSSTEAQQTNETVPASAEE